MSEIKPGMIGITNDRLYIAVVTKVTPKYIYGKMTVGGYEYIMDKDKYSFYESFFDIVKSGDYINGIKVLYISKSFVTLVNGDIVSLDDMDTFVTYEQFNNKAFDIRKGREIYEG